LLHAGLGSELGYFSVNGTSFNFTSTVEAIDPPPPAIGRADILWQNDGGKLRSG
jgi:hypothetical protein